MKGPAINRLKLNYDEPLSNVGSNFCLRRYIKDNYGQTVSSGEGARASVISVPPAGLALGGGTGARISLVDGRLLADAARHGMTRILSPGLFMSIASYDVANDICQALVDGVGRGCQTLLSTSKDAI